MTSREGSNALRLPNFLLIGAMKAGTTSMYHYLGEHPQVFMPAFKALEFFAGGVQWDRGVEWYSRHFAPAPADAVALGEASNVYTKYPRYPGVPSRIAEYIPDARLIYVVRDPIERIRSHYETRLFEGSEEASLGEAVESNPIYLDYSRYALQIEQYLEHFRREQLLLATSESLRADRAATMRRVYEFLGVDPAMAPAALDREFYRSSDKATRSIVPVRVRKALKTRFPASRRAKEFEANVTRTVRRIMRRPEPQADRVEIPPAVRDRLVRALAPDVERLRSYMGPDFDGWGIA